MSERIQTLLRRFNHAKTIGMTWEDHFEDIYDYFMPNRNIAKQSAAGERHNIHLYDTTGSIAVRSFVSQLHVGLTPPSLEWLKLEPGSEIPEDKKKAVTEDLEKTTTKIFKYINDSNFDLAISEAYNDLAVGTGALVINEGPPENPLIFSAIPLLRIYLEEGIMGDIETVWREIRKFPVRNIKRTWPQAKINDALQLMLDTDPNAEIDLVEGTVFDPSKKNYEYVLMHDRTRSFIVDERVLSSAWVVFRGFKRADEVYGRGPADQALPTMQSLNAMQADMLKSAALRANPIFLGASDGVFNPHTVKLTPWSIIPISPTSMGQPPLTPVPMSGEVNFAIEQIQALQNQINKIFFASPLGPLDTRSQLTATEVLIRNQEQLEEKIPFIGRLQYELLDKLTQRIVFILHKKGLIPDIKIDGKEVQVKYKSPIIKSQGLQNVNSFVQFSQTLQSTIGPQLATALLNVAKLPGYLAEQLEIDPELVGKEDEISKALKTLTQAQQQPQLPGAPVGGLGAGSLPIPGAPQ